MTSAVLETPLSAVKNVRQTCTQPLTFGEAVNAITELDNASTITEIRRFQNAGETAKAKQIKKSLPAILFAGTFNKRSCEGLLQHSGLLVLDFDDCDIEKKKPLADDPHSVLCFVSPRGTGLKLVIRIDPATNAAEHGESFDEARKYFLEQYGVDADKSGRDVARLCFVSHDPDAIFHETAEVLHRPHRLYRPHTTTHDIIDNTSNGGEEEGGEVSSAPPTHTVDEILSMTQPTQPGQRHRQVFNLARGLAFECGLANKPLLELKPIVRRWYDMAKEKIGTQSFSESWSDFVHAWPRVKKPLSTNALAAAWDAVQEGELPPVAQGYDKEEIQSLIGLCWQLGEGADSFYLSTHKAGALLDVKPMQILRWLKMLQVDEIIVLVKPGSRTLAHTYRWTYSLPA